MSPLVERIENVEKWTSCEFLSKDRNIFFDLNTFEQSQSLKKRKIKKKKNFDGIKCDRMERLGGLKIDNVRGLKNGKVGNQRMEMALITGPASLGSVRFK